MLFSHDELEGFLAVFGLKKPIRRSDPGANKADDQLLMALKPFPETPTACERPLGNVRVGRCEKCSAAGQSLVRRRGSEHGGGYSSLYEGLKPFRRAADNFNSILVFKNPVAPKNLSPDKIEIGISGISG
jgi:hypothetical protein